MIAPHKNQPIIKMEQCLKENGILTYVVPIYDSPNLDDLLIKCNLLPDNLKDKEKVKAYSKIFPLEKSGNKKDSVQLQEFVEVLKKDGVLILC